MQHIWHCSRSVSKGRDTIQAEIEAIASLFASEITNKEEGKEPLRGSKLEKRLQAAARVLSVLSHIHKQLRLGTFATQRSLYYNAPRLFGTQTCSNNTLKAVCTALGVPRQSLHVLPSATGCLAGSVSVTVELPDQDPTELHLLGDSSKPSQIPSSCACITRLVTLRGCTLFVEKETVFAALGSLKGRIPVSMVVTGKGETDAATRAMLAGAPRPIYGLVDGDAYGVAILARVAGIIGGSGVWINWRHVPDIVPLGLFLDDTTVVKAEGERKIATLRERKLARRLSDAIILWLSERPRAVSGWGKVLRTLELIESTGIHLELESVPSIVDYVVDGIMKHDKGTV